MKLGNILLLLALSLSACEQPTELGMDLEPAFSVGGAVESATGSWAVSGVRTFAFNAHKDAHGNVSGRWQRVNQSTIGPSNGRVVCLSIVGNQAWIGTVGEQGDLVGREGGFRVRDNGAGKNAPPDQMSGQLVNFGPGFAQFYCNAMPGVPRLRTVGAGTVHVAGSAAAQSTQFFPFNFPGVPTCAEPVDVSGSFHPVFQFTTDESGGFHFKGHFNATGIGVGQITNAIYNWNDAINFEDNFRPPQETFTSQQSLELIGRGDAVNQRLRALFHVTVTPNGVVNITADNFTVDCG